jgi:hypothetical protein
VNRNNVLGIVDNQKNVLTMESFALAEICGQMARNLTLDEQQPSDNLYDNGFNNARVQCDITAEVPQAFRSFSPNMLHLRTKNEATTYTVCVMFNSPIVLVRLDRRPSGPELGDEPAHPVHTLVLTEDPANYGHCLLHIYDVTNEYPVLMNHSIGELDITGMDAAFTGLHYVTDHMIELATREMSMCINLPLC